MRVAKVITIHTERKSKSKTPTTFVHRQCQISQVSLLRPSLLIVTVNEKSCVDIFPLGNCVWCLVLLFSSHCPIVQFCVTNIKVVEVISPTTFLLYFSLHRSPFQHVWPFYITFFLKTSFDYQVDAQHEHQHMLPKDGFSTNQNILFSSKYGN